MKKYDSPFSRVFGSQRPCRGAQSPAFPFRRDSVALAENRLRGVLILVCRMLAWSSLLRLRTPQHENRSTQTCQRNDDQPSHDTISERDTP